MSKGSFSAPGMFFAIVLLAFDMQVTYSPEDKCLQHMQAGAEPARCLDWSVQKCGLAVGNACTSDESRSANQRLSTNHMMPCCMDKTITPQNNKHECRWSMLLTTPDRDPL